MQTIQQKLPLDTIWEKIVAYEIATQEELELVAYMDGYNRETLNDVIYIRTGYRDIEQFEDCEVK